jgi:hypothetical protein
MGLQRGNSNEMEQRVGEPDRVIEDPQEISVVGNPVLQTWNHEIYMVQYD